MRGKDRYKVIISGGLTKAGTIIVYHASTNRYASQDAPANTHWIDPDLVENFPEFFEKVVDDPKDEEQAKQLYEDMFYKIPCSTNPKHHHQGAKDCAVIAIEWMLNKLDEISIGESGTTKIDYGQSDLRPLRSIIKNL